MDRKEKNRQRRQDALTARHPRHLETRYRRRLLEWIRAIGRLVDEEVQSILARHADEIDYLARTDSQEIIVEEIERRIGGIRVVAERTWTDREIEDFTTEIAGQMDLFEKNQITQQWSAVAGVDPILGDRLTAGLIHEFSMENLRLIKDMPDEFLRQVQDELVDATRSGTRASDFSEIVQERLKVGESRARLIARDQIASMNGALTEIRQRELGITEFVWSASDDERVRDLHDERDGQTFSWDHEFNETPDDGPPGRPINCRCVSVPVIPD